MRLYGPFGLALTLIQLPGCLKGDCPHLVEPAQHYTGKNSLDCDVSTKGDCLDKAEAAARVQGNNAALGQACWHSRRAAKIESRIDGKGRRCRARLENRAARHRDAEANLVRAAQGPSEDKNAPKGAPAPDPAIAQPKGGTPARRVLLTRHTEAEHETDPPGNCLTDGDDDCPLTEAGKAMAGALSEVLGDRIGEPCAVAFKDFVRTEDTASIATNIGANALTPFAEGDAENPWNKPELKECQDILVVGRSSQLLQWTKAAFKVGEDGPNALMSGEHGVMLVFSIDAKAGQLAKPPPAQCRYGEVPKEVEHLPLCSEILQTDPN